MSEFVFITGHNIKKLDALRETMRSGMTGADVVIHNAGWYEPGISHSAQALMQSINVKGTENVLSLALERRAI